jgi:DNA repair protein RecN (Recombination protein N)
MVTVGALAERIGPLIDLHGQHEHQSLLSTAVQLEYLDQFAGSRGEQALAAYQQCFLAHQRMAEELEKLRQASRDSEQTITNAQHMLRQIEAVDPKPGEYEDLERQLPILRNGESLAVASQEALSALRGEAGALDALAHAHRTLSQQARVDTRLDELTAQLESVSITAEDLASALRAYHESVEFDPRALDEALSRLNALEGLRRRYGPRMEDVFTLWQEATERLSLTENLTEHVQAAKQQLNDAEEALIEAAEALAQVRLKAAADFTAALNMALKDFAMEGSTVEFSSQQLPRQSWTEKGSARYELMYKPAKTSAPRPLARIASGGELSRVMLATKTLFRADQTCTTLVFDQVDAGIGGNTATVIAERIRLLADDNQVIVVTHLAQIAAVAHRQFVVEKSLVDGVATTVIHEVSGQERIAEIARMLSGRVDDIALEHAETLLRNGGAL